MLKGKNIYLRVVDIDDATTLFLWENNPDNWKISHTEVPFSMTAIHELVENQSEIRKYGQLRFMICELESDFSVGTIDLFDTNFQHGFASVGILIAEEKERRKGYAKEALQLLITYCSEILQLRNLKCNIHDDNEASCRLFEEVGFQLIGTKLNWLRYKNNYYDDKEYQLCLNEQ